MGSPATAGFGVWGYGVSYMRFLDGHIRKTLREGKRKKQAQSEASSKHRRCDPKAKRPHTS